MRDTQRERERGRDTSRGRSRLHAGSPMQDLIPGLQNHALGWRQALNHWDTQGFPQHLFFLEIVYIYLRERQYKQEEGQRERKRDKQTPC